MCERKNDIILRRTTQEEVCICEEGARNNSGGNMIDYSKKSYSRKK